MLVLILVLTVVVAYDLYHTTYISFNFIISRVSWHKSLLSAREKTLYFPFLLIEFLVLSLHFTLRKSLSSSFSLYIGIEWFGRFHSKAAKNLQCQWKLEISISHRRTSYNFSFNLNYHAHFQLFNAAGFLFFFFFYHRLIYVTPKKREISRETRARRKFSNRRSFRQAGYGTGVHVAPLKL